MRGRNLPSGSSSASGANKKLQCSRAYKRRAKKEEDDENDVDIISELPDDILHHIFSFLEMKQAIQTCILSRRWRYFWVSLPTLKFTYWEGRSIAIRNEFMAFVDRVLMFRGNSNIHGFVLLTDQHIDVTDRLNTWILASVIRNVQELALRSQFSEKFHFHHCLFTCKSLTKLVVRADSNGVSISFPDSITLPRLKTLLLESVKFEDENSTDRLLSSCPVLESLIITSCEFPGTNVNISSPVLQHLRLSYCRTRSNTLDLDPVDTNFQLCAPNLISFSWYNDMSKQFAPKNLSSLVKAGISTIEYEDSKLSKEKKAMYAPFMVNILRGLHNVEDLTLSSSFLEVVTGAPYLLDSRPTEFCNLRCLNVTDTWSSIDNIHAVSYLLKISPNMETLFVEVEHGAPPDLLEMQPAHFCNLRCLKMVTLLSSGCIYAIAYLLKISPQIETLSFKVSYSSDILHPYWNPDEITSNSAKRGDYWKAGLSLEGLLNHVKWFELLRVTGRVNELEFIEILLKNAMLLEELVIIFQEASFGEAKELEEERLGRLAKFSEKVITRASDLLDSQLMKFCNLRYLKLTGTWRSVDCIHAISYLLKISPIIETLFVEVYHGAPDLLELQPAQFCNLRCLKMNTLLSRDCIYAIAYLLKISPQIETLSFKVLLSIREMQPYWDPDEVTSNSAERGDYWKAVLSLECLLNHVKCVELHNVMGLINELEFIEILLMNAMLLEKLLVFTTIYSVDAETERRRIKFSEKVLTFPRSSSIVVIMFK